MTALDNAFFVTWPQLHGNDSHPFRWNSLSAKSNRAAFNLYFVFHSLYSAQLPSASLPNDIHKNDEAAPA